MHGGSCEGRVAGIDTSGKMRDSRMSLNRMGCQWTLCSRLGFIETQIEIDSKIKFEIA